MFVDFNDLNKIRTNLLDAPKVEFVTNKNSYYYEVMPFRFKNTRD